MPEFLTFVETTVFTKRISALGLEESSRRLQLELLDTRKLVTSNPEQRAFDGCDSAIRPAARGSAGARAFIICGSPIGAGFICCWSMARMRRAG